MYKRDRVLRAIAKVIVWLENLIGEINDLRFIEASKQIERQKPVGKLVIHETKVVNEKGYVLSTMKRNSY